MNKKKAGKKEEELVYPFHFGTPLCMTDDSKLLNFENGEISFFHSIDVLTWRLQKIIYDLERERERKNGTYHSHHLLPLPDLNMWLKPESLWPDVHMECSKVISPCSFQCRNLKTKGDRLCMTKHRQDLPTQVSPSDAVSYC